MAPGLEQYGRAKEYIKHLKYEIEEIVQVLKDTDEDYQRLKISQKYLLNNDVELNYEESSI